MPSSLAGASPKGKLHREEEEKDRGYYTFRPMEGSGN